MKEHKVSRRRERKVQFTQKQSRRAARSEQRTRNLLPRQLRRASQPSHKGRLGSSVPITLTYASQGTHRLLRLRTKGSELAAQTKPREQTSTARSILLANALKIEAILKTGGFKNATDLARTIGVSKKYLSTMLGMLNIDVTEMEKVLMVNRVDYLSSSSVRCSNL